MRPLSEPRSRAISDSMIYAIRLLREPWPLARSADAELIAGPREYSDDDAVRSPGGGTETDGDGEVREISRRSSTIAAATVQAESEGHYKSHYSGESELMPTHM